MKKYGFVLGGGAARGLAHIGIMKVCYENNIKPSVIAGTSMGAIVGSLLAIGMEPREIEEEVKKVSVYSMVDFSLSKAGLFSGEKIEQFLKTFLGNVTFDALKIPLRVCAVDIEHEELVIIKTGKVLPAIRASMSIPGIFIPIKHQRKFLVDGGVIDNLPINALDDIKVDEKIAISVRRSSDTPLLYREYFKVKDTFSKRLKYSRTKLMFNILKKTYDIIMREQEKRMMDKYPDVRLCIPKMDNYDYTDFFHKEKIIEKGYKEGKKFFKNCFSDL